VAQEEAAMSGPLRGLRVLEFGAIGPAPFAAMMLADMGADVVRVRRGGAPIAEDGATARGRSPIDLNLKDPAAREIARDLARRCDVLIEGYRPGVMERLGLGPEGLLADNPALVYARMTGWGQSGPLAHTAGHDIDYIAITGALDAIGAPERPAVPLNLVGDYGGGALYLVVGILAAYVEARKSGRGQVVDAAICDGTVSMMSLFHAFARRGQWRARRGANMLDGGAPFYRAYECGDGRFIAVGAIEPRFYALLREMAGWSDPCFDPQMDRGHWPEAARRAEALMRTRTRDEWMALFEGSDACVAPVLTLEESPDHPHLKARGCFVEVDGQRQSAPAPRFSRTPSRARASARDVDIGGLLARWTPGPRT
jgi:alpha-methylacyl-CoA racemase